MPCNDRWRDELADHVLGAPAGSGLKEHLENCAECSATLRRWQLQMGRIDAGIRQLTSSEPSAQAALHILADVRAQPQRPWWPGWRWQAAALCGLLITGASLTYRWQAREQARTVLAAASAIAGWRSPTDGLLRSSTVSRLNAPPELGKYFYRLNSDIPRKERENP